MLITEQRAICLMATAALVAVTIGSIFVDIGAGEPSDYSDLLNLTMGIEDARMNAQDLAFLLIIHDFDARPQDGYVIVKINSTVYKMTPNEDKPGLAEIMVLK